MEDGSGKKNKMINKVHRMNKVCWTRSCGSRCSFRQQSSVWWVAQNRCWNSIKIALLCSSKNFLTKSKVFWILNGLTIQMPLFLATLQMFKFLLFNKEQEGWTTLKDTFQSSRTSQTLSERKQQGLISKLQSAFSVYTALCWTIIGIPPFLKASCTCLQRLSHCVCTCAPFVTLINAGSTMIASGTRLWTF